jgi:hypothetical protein
MKAKALPFIAFEHKRLVSASLAHQSPAARISETCWLVYAVSRGFFFVCLFRGVPPARDFRSCVSEIFWDFTGISIRGEKSGAEFGQCRAWISAFLM